MTTAEGIRAQARQRLRDAMLDAARELALGAGGWAGVRMGAVAHAVGVSRQRLHAEFGTKDALGQALVLRETERFLTGVVGMLHACDGRLEAGLDATVTFTLLASADDPLLQSVLENDGGEEGDCCPCSRLADSRSCTATLVLSTWVCSVDPGLDPPLVAEVAASVVRLVISHAVLPQEPPAVVGERLARLAIRMLRTGD